MDVVDYPVDIYRDEDALVLALAPIGAIDDGAHFFLCSKLFLL